MKSRCKQAEIKYEYNQIRFISRIYLMLFAALTNSVCLNNASLFFFFSYIIFFMKGQ